MTTFAGAISFADAAPAPQGYPGTATTIRINNDGELSAAAALNGWAGEGTLASPWIIAGNSTTHDLDMKGGAFGIYIANITSHYFNVQDWHIYNSTNGDGLTIKNTMPFQVTNLTINNVMNGVVTNNTAGSSSIRRVSLDNIGMDGIRVGNSSWFYIENNNVNNATHAIKTIYCDWSFVRNNTLTDGQGSIFVHLWVSGITLYRTTFTVASNNSISDINVAIHPQWGDNNTIEHNQIFHCAEGIYLDQASRFNLIESNHIYNMTERAIALNYDATQNTVASNVITNCSWGGIYSARSVRANIHDNVITQTGIGIDMTVHSNSAQIVNNRIESNGVGITLLQSNLTTIQWNYIANSTHQGLIIQESDRNVVQNNSFFENLGYGIQADNCNTSRFVLNLMTGNNGATSVHSPSHVQAFDNRSTDLWNTAIQGNYWSDWTSPDANNDSIVDVPYAIDGAAARSDSFPLAYPVAKVNDLQGSTGYIWAKITWSAPNYSAGDPLPTYRINRTNGTTSVIFNTGATQFNDTSVTPSIDYDYKVIAINKYGQSGIVNISLFILPSDLPVVNITAPADGAFLATTDVNVVWEGWANGAAITSYWLKINGRSWFNASLATSHLFNAAQGVAVGINTVSVNVTNANGSSTTSIQFTVDLTAPVVSILKPANGYLNNTGSVLVAWHAIDTYGISQYQLRVGSGAWQLKGLSESTTLPLPDGRHVITVKAIDPAGNSGLATVNVTVDTTRPQIINMHPEGGSYVNTSSVTFTWDIIEAVSGVNRTNVSVDSGPVTNILYNKSYTTGVLSQGPHVFHLVVFDNASFNSSMAVQFFVDSVAPSLSITNPLNGTIFATSSINLTWSAAGTGTSITLVQYRMNAGPWSDVPNLGYKLLSLADDQYLVQMRVFDQANNSATAQSNFTVDTVAPALSIYAPVNDTYLNTSSVLVKWNMSDSTSGIAQVWLALDNGSFAPIGVVNQTTVVTADGWHTVHLQVQDLANNSAWDNVTFFVDTHDPIVGILVPPNGAFIGSSNVTMEYAGTDIFDPSSGILYYEVRNDTSGWFDNGANVTFTFLGLSEGAHTLYVKAVDRAGNFDIDSVDIIVDTVDPIVTIDFPANGAKFNVTHLNMTWTYTDFTPVQQFNVSLDGIAWSSAGTQTWYEFVDLPQGTNVLWLQATDMTNHTSIASVSVVVDTMAPWIQFVQPMDGQVLASKTILVIWNVTDNTTGVQAIWIWLDSVKQANITVEQNYTFTGLAEGNHTIAIQAWDNLLNEQISSITVKVDTIAPFIVITQPRVDQYLKTKNVTLAFTVTDGANGSGVAENFYAVDAGIYHSLGTGTSTVLLNLANGAYRVHVRTVDLAGNSREVARNFTVDTVAPTVTASSPSGGAVVVTASITATFSENMNKTSVKFTVNTLQFSPTSWSGNVATYVPSTALFYATNYTVVVSGKDLAGNDVTGSAKSFLFATKCLVTGTVKDDKGNPIFNATVTLKQGSNVIAQGRTDANGSISLVVPAGSYNLTISADQKKDYTKAVVVALGASNVLPPLTMQNVDNWSWLYIVIIIIVIAVIALFLYMRKKGGAKPVKSPKNAEQPKAQNPSGQPKK